MDLIGGDRQILNIKCTNHIKQVIYNKPTQYIVISDVDLEPTCDYRPTKLRIREGPIYIDDPLPKLRHMLRFKA